MNFGTHTTVERLADRLQHRWVSKWHEAFADPKGGFYERLGHGFQPVSTGNRRLLTQCRQLSIYSHSGRVSSDILGKHFEDIVQAYALSTSGAWRYTTDDERAPLDNTIDLYTLSFIIFSFSHYAKATGDKRAKVKARETLDFISRHFRKAGSPGLMEALDQNFNLLTQIRRQNPHMHLLEACLFAHETWNDAAYMVMADEMIDLFFSYFYDPELDKLCEFFDDGLAPHPEKGDRVEPGHYFEWVWLLKKHAAAKNQPALHDQTCIRILNWANCYGWDQTYGGIYDVLNSAGTVLSDTKRLWPFAEALKANALMLDSHTDRDALKARIADMVAVFRDKYMQERGFWVEWLNRDLSPATDYMPGTTPYHVYFGIMETRDVLRGRGKSVSLRAWPMAALYKIRRALSSLVRRFRLGIKSA